ncbi:MAG TPA: hypothetical protein VGN26_01795 [Armatimonadota bacterium]|jgi:hypothetical protein
MADATWYTASVEEQGLGYRFPTGALAGARYLTADFLVDGSQLVVLALRLQEGEDGPTFQLIFSALNQCSARLRMELSAVDQNRWQYPREGSCLKPMCGGDRVDLSRVDRMTLTVLRKGDEPARWCMTDFTAQVEEPPRLAESELVLPKGPLLDELGQSTLHQWPAKSKDAEEVVARLKGQLEAAANREWPEGFSRWGGWTGKRHQATGFFRTLQDEGRWWLVDPDGHPFWSSGMDCVTVDCQSAYQGLRPALSWMPDPEGEFRAIYGGGHGGGPTINYLAANLIRAFGPERYHECWAQIALGELRGMGFNTVANWSEWRIAKAAGFPYVRPLHPAFSRTPMVYRDFPDVFHPAFAEEAAEYAEDLRETADDPALIGYFLMNEPTWGFSAEAPAAGLLFNAPEGPCRRALRRFLAERYGSDEGMREAWGPEASLRAVETGWQSPLNRKAEADLKEFSSVMVARLFGGLTEACRKVDPNHLNLGARYYTVPPAWALEGMRCFDVFSMNCYNDHVPADLVTEIHRLLGVPVMVGEWHFGALDVGLPGSGIGRVKDQAARGQAFRYYVENAAAQPACVGVHYFTLYDESALGRFDGENWNIGFLDVCNRPYEPLQAAATETHRRLYDVARGAQPPFEDAPEYLPKVFL